VHRRLIPWTARLDGEPTDFIEEVTVRFDFSRW